MEILIPLLIALIILGISVILNRRKKAREQSNKLDKHAKNEDISSTTSRVESPTSEKTVQQDGSVEDARATPETPSLNEDISSTTSRVESPTPEKTVQQDGSVEDARATPETPSISEPKTPYHTAQLSETPAKVSEPSNYPDSWEKTSRHYKEQKEWQCEMCKLSLHQHKYYLHTHHIYGTRYDNLMALCIGCHSEQPGINHLLLKETSDYQGFIARYGKKWRMSNISDFERIRNKFREYVKHESNILHYIGSRDAFIKYESDCPKENGSRVVWMNAWIPHNRDKISAVISIRGDSRYFQSHYQKLEARKSKIEKAFSFEVITLSKVPGNIYQLRVEKEDVDLTQIANLDTNFHWLRENLEKLYWVLRVHETFKWDTVSSTESSSEENIPLF